MLTAAEQKELAELDKKFGTVKSVPRGLTEAESRELAELDKKFGPKPEPEGLGRRLTRSALDTLPVVGGLSAGLLAAPATGLGALPAGALGYAGGKHLARLGKHYLLGDSLETQGLIGSAIQTGKDVKEGAEFEMLGQSAAAIPGLIRDTGKGLKKFAEKSAVNATGATGKQASEFSEDAGRQLLDRKIVKFGDTQEKIAKRAAEAVKVAERDLDNALSSLSEKGVKVDENTIYNVIRSKIKDMARDPSKADVAKALDNELTNVLASAEARGSAEVPILEAETIKRGYNRKAGNWMDPDKSMTGKEMYRAYRKAVEKVAESNPKLAKMFKDAKKSYGLLAPIEESAARRAATTQQSPAGGFLDVTSAIGGAAAGGPAMAIGAPIARRIIAPRISSSTAVIADKVANGLLKTQYFAKMAEQNPEAFNALVISIVNKKGETGLIQKAAAQE